MTARISTVLSGTLVATALILTFIAKPAIACSLVNVEGSTAEAVKMANYYWAASGLLGAALVMVALYRRRWKLNLAVVIALLAFHPARTVRPFHAPDCSFDNVVASQAVLWLLGLMFAYQLFRTWRDKQGGVSAPTASG
ncbi:hypothetical protein ACVIIV_005880 [Bradyrhizobium sp. USDA 4354]